MSSKSILILNARMVLPNTVQTGDLLITDRRIEQIIPAGDQPVQLGSDWEVIDAAGKYLLPGIIDMHSDAIEKEISPRAKTYFPVEASFYELDKKVAASGITTIYHSLSLSGEAGLTVRNDQMVLEIIEKINRNNSFRSLVRNLVHLRYEIANLSGLEMVRKILQQRQVQLLSFMDHTPGQGQFAALGSYEQYITSNCGFNLAEARAIVAQAKLNKEQVDAGALQVIADLARQQGIVLASHDDDTPAKVDIIQSWGVTISEFPINLETAHYAKSKNMQVAVGAPNVVRGGSHGNNLRAIEAIKAGAADLLCSDYYPPSMLAAVFKLTAAGFDLPLAVRMVSLNPARALKLEQRYGSIEVGKIADLVLVELYQDHPFVCKTLVGGQVIYQTEYPAYQQQREDRWQRGELVC
ncbi:MAG: alpha-D-ribose 1-methylphosphonate 5-triphosphate diphosphatase [Desulfotomaculum sp.]|nr:alpha-D-ribose 1-methylphosphonate 5-triphosphate diphosphatase [Desulfotomaculum sp.]